jgi:hypothetical protein
VQIKEVFPPASSGVYEVASACVAESAFISCKSYAHCDMDTDGGKWTLIQSRFDGSEDFYRNWTDYVNGFGDLDGELWYGLDNIHYITTNNDMELRIELGNGPEPSIVWTYQLFRVGGADTNYTLTIGEGNGVGDKHDSMIYHNGRPFSTWDRDNDAAPGDCARFGGGAWWYNNCFFSNLNGRYEFSTPEDGGATVPATIRLVWSNGLQWQRFTKVQMKVRPKKCGATVTCK